MTLAEKAELKKVEGEELTQGEKIALGMLQSKRRKIESEWIEYARYELSSSRSDEDLRYHARYCRWDWDTMCFEWFMSTGSEDLAKDRYPERYAAEMGEEEVSK